MIEVYFKYGQALLQFYKEKVKEGQLPTNLKHPTPANLKQECFMKCSNQLHKKDIPALKEFLGKGNNQEECLKAIRSTAADKFKPLGNFLRGGTTNTDLKKLELLAWLIDFERRPYDNWNRNSGHADPLSEEGEREIETSEYQPIAIQPSATITNLYGKGDTSGLIKTSTDTPAAHPIKKALTQTNLLGISVVLALGIGTYLFWNRNSTEPIGLLSPNSCMYWTGEYYKQVSCNQKLGDTLIVALEPQKLTGFRKISQPDTITLKAIGHVWYIKINKGIEYYTGPGNHPIDPTRKLRPITGYMINKYILSDSTKQKRRTL